MITVRSEHHDQLLILEMSGMVTETDLEACFVCIDEMGERRSISRVICDWQALEGWAPGARLLGTWFGMRHWATVARVAVIAEETWHDEVLRIEDIFKAARVHRFRPAEAEAAWRWIRED